MEINQKFFEEKANNIIIKKKEIKEKYLEENKIFNTVNEEILKKNKKRYDELKNAKELIEKKIKEKAEEILEQNKIRVNQMKKDDDKEKDNQNNEKGSIKSKKDEKNEKEKR